VSSTGLLCATVTFVPPQQASPLVATVPASSTPFLTSGLERPPRPHLACRVFRRDVEPMAWAAPRRQRIPSDLRARRTYPGWATPISDDSMHSRITATALPGAPLCALRALNVA